MNNRCLNIKKTYIVLMIIMFVCFSCTKEKRREIIKNEVTKNESYTETNSTNANMEESRFIINKRTGKIHSYTHGIKVVSDKYQLESNEDIEKILENENYDICLNCYAGLKLNLDKYKTNDRNISNDEVDITNNEVNLIKHYMNMYEFGKLDIETQKFLICIFEVGSWYVNNVYTQLGGQNDVVKTELIARASASDAAYNKWRNYLDNEYYSKYELRNEKKILPTLYDYEKRKYSKMVAYRCDLFKDAGYGKGNTDDTKIHMQTLKNPEGEEIFKEYKNYCVIDDSSKFATAVYYHYMNKEVLKDRKLEDRIAYGIDLWETNSTAFSKKNSFTKKIYNSRNFEVITWDMLKKVKENNNIELYYYGEKFTLQPGDLVYRKINYDKNIEGHVEFIIGKDKVVGWGRVNKNYTLLKTYTPKMGGYFSNDSKDQDQPFVTIIRFKGEQVYENY